MSKLPAKIEGVKIPGLKLSISVGPNSPKAEVLREVDRICQMLNNYMATGKRIGLLLGAVMTLVQDGEFYKPEFATFEAYRLHIAKLYGLGRSTVSDDMQIARAFPKMTVDQARAIPTANLSLVARAVKKGNKAEAGKLLAAAKNTPIIEFRRMMERRGLITQRKTPGLVRLILKVTKNTRRDWNKFRAGRTDEEVLSAIVGPGRKKTANAR